MADIQTYLNKIKNAVYGKDVRQAIHDAIHQCYQDGKAGELDLVAREQIASLSNSNLLINSDFRNPVNQRKITKYEGGATKGYTVDRWCMGENDFGRTVEIVDGGVKITNPNTTYNGTFQQILETALRGTYTVSIKVSELNGSGIIYCGGTQVDTKKNLLLGITTLTITNATIESVVVQAGPSSNLTVEWIKLEQGTLVTPFVSRAYGDELLSCQRYYYKTSNSNLYSCFGYVNVEGTVAVMTIPLPNNLYKTPTVTFESASLYGNGKAIDVTSIATIEVFNNLLQLQIKVSGLGTNEVLVGRFKSLEISAEIK